MTNTVAAQPQSPETAAKYAAEHTAKPVYFYFPMWIRKGGHWAGLSLAAKALYPMLASYADFETGCNAKPSQRTLAKDTGIDIKTVRKALNELERAGFIIIRNREQNRVANYMQVRTETLCQTLANRKSEGTTPPPVGELCPLGEGTTPYQVGEPRPTTNPITNPITNTTQPTGKENAAADSFQNLKEEKKRGVPSEIVAWWKSIPGTSASKTEIAKLEGYALAELQRVHDKPANRWIKNLGRLLEAVEADQAEIQRAKEAADLLEKGENQRRFLRRIPELQMLAEMNDDQRRVFFAGRPDMADYWQWKCQEPNFQCLLEGLAEAGALAAEKARQAIQQKAQAKIANLPKAYRPPVEKVGKPVRALPDEAETERRKNEMKQALAKVS